VINFPERPRILREGGQGDDRSEAATIIILPVIRIERLPDPSDGIEPHSDTPGGKRRRRSSRP
jgi:hypothetical protein